MVTMYGKAPVDRYVWLHLPDDGVWTLFDFHMNRTVVHLTEALVRDCVFDVLPVFREQLAKRGYPDVRWPQPLLDIVARRGH